MLAYAKSCAVAAVLVAAVVGLMLQARWERRMG